MKVKTKLITSFSILLVLLLIMDSWAYFSISKLYNSVSMVEKNLLQLDLISRLQLTIEKMLAPSHDYTIHGKSEEKETFNTRFTIVESMLAGLGKADLTEEEKKTLAEAKVLCTDIKEMTLEIFNLEPSTVSNMLSIQPAMLQMDKQSEKLTEKIEALNIKAYEGTIKAISQSKISTHTTDKILFVFTGLIFINAFIIGLFILAIVKPIKLLIDGAELIGHGKLDHRVDVRSQDELRDLADAFNKMVGNLEKSLVDIEGEKEKLEAVLLDIGDGIVVGDAKYNLLYMNPIAEKILKKSCKDLHGKKFFGCHKEDDKVMHMLKYDQLPVITKINYDHQILYINAASIKGVDGKPIGYTMIVRDVTSQEKVLKEKLEVL